jgi:hypothetical protein
MVLWGYIDDSGDGNSILKEAMEWEQQENAAIRKAKGESKRGRKPKSILASGRASSGKN